MKVLMLGWEFPPHISGGLGTACHGLTVGLAHAGVEVLFVVPRAYGDETAEHMRLLGANQVRFLRRVFVPAADAGPGGDTFGGGVVAGDGSIAATLRGELAEDLERLEAGSAEVRYLALERLMAGAATETSFTGVRGASSPYDDPGQPRDLPADVRDRLAQWFTSGGSTVLQLGERALQKVPTDAAGWRVLSRAIRDAVLAHSRAPTPSPGPKTGRFEVIEERLDMVGGYGGDLYAEVARYALAVGEIAANEHFDVIHAHDWITFPAAAVAAEISGKKVVAHVHASEYDRSGDHPNLSVKAIEQLGLDIASRVVCVSHYTASILKRRYRVDPAKLRVVHNAVTQEEQRAQWHGERNITDPIVLFLGRVTFQKGPDYFLEAAARVVKLRPDVLFVVSGSGDMLPAMVERSARLGLVRNVVFTGFLRGKAVERMYSMADLYVMPSVSEPFGITPLEAMALDVPVIVSRQSGVSEILTHALKVDFWDVEELANKILAVLEYPALRASLVESGRDEVRRMRWELRGELVRDVYQEILK